MSEDRVNITHSVKVAKVPEAVRDLVKKVYNSDYRSLSSDFDDLLGHLEKQNEKKALEKIESIRKKLMNIDFCMDDSHNILFSYQKYLLGVSEEDDA